MCTACARHVHCHAGAPYYMAGLLDQGYWPDGLYTAPSDEALASDIVAAKALGFNLLRKHAKAQPRPLCTTPLPPSHHPFTAR